VWAAGDNVAGPHTAAHALQQGKTLAANIIATLDGSQLKPFALRSRPRCLVGRRSAVAELAFGIRVTGFLGWWMWRREYWVMLPGFGRKLRVGLDWLLGYFVARDRTQLNTSRTQVFGRAHYEAGEYVFRQGDPADRVYMITSGEVEVVRELPTGEEEIAARLADGEFFGENALLAYRRRNASVRCLTPVNVLAIERDEFGGLTEVHQLPRAAMYAADGLGSAPARLVRSSTGEDLLLSLNFDMVSLGRGAQNHIVVADPAVSGRHALIQRDRDAYWAEDLGGPNGTLVNGRRLSERTRLKHGDILRLGSTEFTFELIARQSIQRARRIVLEVCAGELVGKTFSLDEQGGAIGRGPTHNVCIPDASLSRDHARIDFREGDYWLTDLHSTNGTSVNGQRLSGARRLQPGDVIDLGQSRLAVRFHADDPD
jgi:pSer/pThr/pTyr-binding forkhead associated (FHA) protein